MHDDVITLSTIQKANWSKGAHMTTSVYQPLPSKKNASASELFFEEFGSILEQLITEK